MATIQLNMYEGRQNRDAGIAKAVGHAEKNNPGWSNKAYALLKKFLNSHVGSFQAEELRSYAAVEDFELPPSARAWGGIIQKAARERLIKKIDIKPVSNPKANCANAGVWVKI